MERSYDPDVRPRVGSQRGRFHVGGGVGGAADSLLEFKVRFDPEGLIESAVGKAIQ